MLKPSWIVDCCKNQKLLPMSDYRIFGTLDHTVHKTMNLSHQLSMNATQKSHNSTINDNNSNNNNIVNSSFNLSKINNLSSLNQSLCSNRSNLSNTKISPITQVCVLMTVCFFCFFFIFFLCCLVFCANSQFKLLAMFFFCCFCTHCCPRCLAHPLKKKKT